MPMKPFYQCTTTQEVFYTSDDPNTQLVSKEIISTKKKYLYGMISTLDMKDITQHFNEEKKKRNLGF